MAPSCSSNTVLGSVKEDESGEAARGGDRFNVDRSKRLDCNLQKKKKKLSDINMCDLPIVGEALTGKGGLSRVEGVSLPRRWKKNRNLCFK